MKKPITLTLEAISAMLEDAKTAVDVAAIYSAHGAHEDVPRLVREAQMHVINASNRLILASLPQNPHREPVLTNGE